MVEVESDSTLAAVALIAAGESELVTMQPHEVEMSDVFVVLKQKCAENLEEAVATLKRLGMNVTATDPNDGVVEGTIPADKLAQMKSWDCVADVRIDFTYIAEGQV